MGQEKVEIGDKTYVRQGKAKLVKVPTWLNDEEIVQFFSVIFDIHHRFVCQLMYYLGLRVGEVIKIVKSDFNLREKYLRIRAEIAKRGRERLVPIPALFVDAVKFNLDGLPADAPITTYTNSGIWWFVKTYGKRAGLEKHVHPHTLRHSYLSKVMQETNNIALVKDLAGHASIQTTQIYLHTCVKQNKEKIDKVFG